MKNVYKIDADIKGSKRITAPFITQNDAVSFVVSVFDGGKEVDLSDVTVFTLASTRLDKEVVVVAGEQTGVNEVTFDIGTEETKFTGVVRAVVQLYGEDGRVSTVSFSYGVTADPVGNGFIPSEREQTLIETVLGDGPLAIAKAQEAATYAREQGDYVVDKKPLIDKFTDVQTNLQAQVDALVVDGDSSPEAAQARVDAKGTTHTTLKRRLDVEHSEVSQQLADKAKLTDVRRNTDDQPINVREMDTETKALFTGGAVAVVGEDAVGTENIKKKAVTPEVTSFLKTGKNIFNPDTVISGFTLSPTTGAPVASSTYYISPFIPVVAGESFAISNPRYVAFYREDQTFHLESFLNNSGHPPAVVKAPQNGYMRIAISPMFIETIQIERGVVNTPYEPFGYILERLIDPNKEAVSILQEKTNILEKTKNLFDKSSVTTGYYISETDGILRALEKYETSDYIFVEVGKTYVMNHCRKFALFSIDKIFVSGADLNPQTTHSFTANNNGYVRFSYDITLISPESVQMEEGTTPTEVVGYGIKIKGLVIPESQPIQDSPLQGKRLLGFGDSIAQGGSNNGVSYLPMIAERNGMLVSNYARGGATIAPRAGYDNQIIAKVNEAKAAGATADYIVFNGLTNDANVTDESRLGEISATYDMPANVTTFTGAFEQIIKTLRDQWTTAKIVYVRPHNMSSRGSRQILFGNRAIEICRKWSIPVVDMYSEGNLNSQHAEMQRLYTADTYGTGLGDGTHPNDEGYRKFYVPMIEAKLKSI